MKIRPIIAIIWIVILAWCAQKQDVKQPSDAPIITAESDIPIVTAELDTIDQQTTRARIIKVDAKRFEYTPSTIRVKQGENVILSINNIDTLHDIMIEGMAAEVDANSNIVIDTSTPWTYAFGCNFYCGAGHEEMKGTIIVE